MLTKKQKNFTNFLKTSISSQFIQTFDKSGKKRNIFSLLSLYFTAFVINLNVELVKTFLFHLLEKYATTTGDPLANTHHRPLKVLRPVILKHNFPFPLYLLHQILQEYCICNHIKSLSHYFSQFFLASPIFRTLHHLISILLPYFGTDGGSCSFERITVWHISLPWRKGIGVVEVILGIYWHWHWDDHRLRDPLQHVLLVFLSSRMFFDHLLEFVIDCFVFLLHLEFLPDLR